MVDHPDHCPVSLDLSTEVVDYGKTFDTVEGNLPCMLLSDGDAGTIMPFTISLP